MTNRQYTPIPSPLQATSTLGVLNFKAPELEEDQSSATLAFSCWIGRTYDPSRGFAILKFLGISPLLHELVRGIKVGSNGPFTDPQGKVPGCSCTLNPIEVCDTRVSVPATIRGRSLTADVGQVGLWIWICYALQSHDSTRCG